jgi:5-methylcytosine-specific restriction endonuclease McrA|tara:strand:- start:628 stop:1182 length:555 start_codon:yes stop_codon:yes gene_type:complete
MIGLKTLVLNADYQPKSILKLEAISVERSLSDFFANNCVVLNTHDRVIKTPRVENRIAIPSVIAYKKMHKRPNKLTLRNHTLLLRDEYMCVYCETALSEDSMTWDHYVPSSMGGKTQWDNILSACKKCNHDYGRTPAERKKPKHTPYEPTYNKLSSIRRHYDIKVEHESWVLWLQPWFAKVIVA